MNRHHIHIYEGSEEEVVEEDGGGGGGGCGENEVEEEGATVALRVSSFLRRFGSDSRLAARLRGLAGALRGASSDSSFGGGGLAPKK